MPWDRVSSMNSEAIWLDLKSEFISEFVLTRFRDFWVFFVQAVSAFASQIISCAETKKTFRTQHTMRRLCPTWRIDEPDGVFYMRDECGGLRQ